MNLRSFRRRRQHVPGACASLPVAAAPSLHANHTRLRSCRRSSAANKSSRN
jgi:hypothetical protein